jgi:hypothetical protein
LSEIQDPIPRLAADKGRVYFYRSSSAFGAAVTADVKIDHNPVGRSVRGSFFFVDKAPGDYEIETATEWEHKDHVAVAAGSTHYMQTFVTMGVLVGHILIEEHTAEEALPMIQDLAYIGPALGTPAAAGQASVGAKPAAMAEVAAVEVVPLAKAEVQPSVPVTPAVQAPVAVDGQPKVEVAAPVQVQVVPAASADKPKAEAPVVATASPVVNQARADVPKVLGTRSFEVEQLAKENSCEGDGAWLIRQDLSVETYQVNCQNGVAFHAVCEKSGCKQAS